MQTKEFYVTTAALHITYYCTHACSMCYARGEGVHQKHPLLEKLIQVVDKLAEAGVEEISLVGGDPASYPDIEALCKYINSRNITISILSNTLSFSNAESSEMAKYISAFEGTIHSHIPEEHDGFCKSEGAFNMLVQNLCIFKQLGKDVGIALNITPDSSCMLYDIVYELIHTHDLMLDYIVLQRIVPFGEAHNKTDFILLKEHVSSVMKCIAKIHQELGVNIVVEDPFPLCLIEDKYHEYMTHRCEWGWTKVAVNPEGKLSRCGADPRYMLGDLFERPLLEIWNESEILESFRNFSYLPGRCLSCEHLLRCGGGCPLSCSVEKDHDCDYLLRNYFMLDEESLGKLMFAKAEKSDLSIILQIEWSNFSKYQHVFDAKSIKTWFEHNPNMFYVIKDDSGNILAYAIVVPMTKELFDRITKGEFSSLIDFPLEGVKKSLNSDYYHMEAIATLPGMKKLSVSGMLIKGVGDLLVSHAKYVTTSPMTDDGKRLSEYFGFIKVAEENYKGEIYPISLLEISNISKKRLQLF